MTSTTAEKGPWGAWASIGLAYLVWGIAVVVQMMVVTVFAVVIVMRAPSVSAERLAQHTEQIARQLSTDGMVLAVTQLVGAPIVVGLTCVVIHLRHGPSIRAYLGLLGAPWRACIAWGGAALILAAASDLLTVAVGKPAVPEWVQAVIRSPSSGVLLWIALIACAPITEEVMFRGFLLEGLAPSRLGSLGAVAVSSGLWTALHVQYEPVYLLQVFALGVLLGFARLRTRSLPLCIVLHSLYSLAAFVEAAWMG